jgi:hypothetical protein
LLEQRLELCGGQRRIDAGLQPGLPHGPGVVWIKGQMKRNNDVQA